MRDLRTAAVAVKVGGYPIPESVNDLLMSVRVDEAVNLPDAFSLRFNDADFWLLGERIFQMGSEVEIAIDGVVVTRGEVVAMTVDQAPGNRHELLVSGLDVTHRLNRRPRRETYEQMTDGDIVSKVAAKYGLDTDLDPTREVHKYVIQSEETDYSFLQQRARRIGFEIWVAGGTLHFKKEASVRGSRSPVDLRWGEDITKFRVRFSSTDRVDDVTVTGWDPGTKTTIVGRASGGTSGCTAEAATMMASAARSAFGRIERTAADLPIFTQREADEAAASLLEEDSSGTVVARIEIHGNPNVTAGTWLEIDRVGPNLAGEYLGTGVQHLVTDRGYVTRIVAGPRRPTEFADLVGANRSTRRDPSSWGSLVYGVVTDVDDPERLGRVKVQLPELGETVSWWAPVLVPGGGADRGLFTLPEVGDQVVVGFEHDDNRRPMVLGGVYNADDGPPADAVKAGVVVKRVWKSRNGHRLEYVDDDPGSVTLAMGDAEPQLVLNAAESTLAGRDKLVISAAEIELNASKKLTVSAGQVEIQGDLGVAIDGARIELG